MKLQDFNVNMTFTIIQKLFFVRLRKPDRFVKYAVYGILTL